MILLLVQAGGFVRNGRTCGNLSLSRALGDFEFKRNSAPSSSAAHAPMPHCRALCAVSASSLRTACGHHYIQIADTALDASSLAWGLHIQWCQTIEHP